MRLRGVRVGRLDGGEVPFPAFLCQKARNAAPRLSGGDAEHHVTCTEECGDQLGGPLEQRISLADFFTRPGKIGAIGFCEPGLHGPGVLARKHGKRLGQREADDFQHAVAGRHRQPLPAECVLHGGEYRVLAVDQRAIAIEDHELHGRFLLLG